MKKRNDASYITSVITRHLYQQADRKKVCASTFSDYIELTYYWAACHEILAFLQFFKQDRLKEEWTLEEIEGQLHILLKDTWSVFTYLKLSSKTFRSLSLKDIIECKSMDELVVKGTYTVAPPKKEANMEQLNESGSRLNELRQQLKQGVTEQERAECLAEIQKIKASLEARITEINSEIMQLNLAHSTVAPLKKEANNET